MARSRAVRLLVQATLWIAVPAAVALLIMLNCETTPPNAPAHHAPATGNHDPATCEICKDRRGLDVPILACGGGHPPANCAVCQEWIRTKISPDHATELNERAK